MEMFLICPMTSHKHMFNELYEFMGGSFPLSVTILPCLVAIGQTQVEE